MADIDDTIAKLMKAEELEVYEGQVSDTDIARVSQDTGCSLPDDYVRFLKQCGFAIWVGHFVNGVYDPSDQRFPESFNFSAQESTHRARQLHRSDPYPFLNESVVLGADGMGGYFLLVSTTEDTKDRVLWVDYDETWVVTNSWPSFTAFLEEQLA